jgi:hypothetical protein
MHGLTMVEGDHEGDDEDYLLEHKHCKIWQSLSYTSKVVAIKNRDTNSMVSLNPKWPIAKTSCLTWRIWNHVGPLGTYKRPSW